MVSQVKIFYSRFLLKRMIKQLRKNKKIEFLKTGERETIQFSINTTRFLL